MARVLLKEFPYKFNDASLLDDRCFINGNWVQAADKRTFPVYDPTDDAVACQVPDLSVDEVKSAIKAADQAFQVYRQVSARDRRFMLRRWGDLIKEAKSDLAALCTIELGKPFKESLATVSYGIDYIDWFEAEAERIYGETIPAHRKGTRIITVREPQGVVAAITPWNSPVAMVTRKAAAAIAAGNTVVLKPAPETPLCAIAMAKLFERAGFPRGVLNVVTCSAQSAPAVGEELCRNEAVKHLSFTGSTAVGKLLNTQCAAHIKKTSLELGGNAPFIVFDDANIDSAVDGLISSKFRSSGQTCICANRVLVQEAIYTAFAARLKERVKETICPSDSVWNDNCNYGPLYSGKAMEKVQRHVKDAVQNGAEVLLGGTGDPTFGSNYFAPTIITNAKPDMLFCQEETFGPVAFLVSFKEQADAIEIANRTSSGLAAYIYTESINRLWTVSEALQVGMVGCRVGLISACEQPFSGVKESGIGIEGSSHALEEYVNMKSITIGGL